MITTTALAVRSPEQRTYGTHWRIAVIPWDSATQEDAYLVNARLNAYGVTDSIHHHTFRFFNHRGRTGALGREQIGRPDPALCRPMTDTNFSDVHPNGLTPTGTCLSYGKPAIAVTSVVQNHKPSLQKGGMVDRVRDQSIHTRREPGIVTVSESRQAHDGMSSAKVTVQSRRSYGSGDKQTSRHGQKGVVACMMRDSDMPYEVTEGWTPDAIVNCAAFPTRFTPSQTLEATFAMGALMDPDNVDRIQNPMEQSHEQRRRLLESFLAHGIDPMGTVELRHPRTGKIIQGQVFCGPVYIEQLPHIAADKASASGRCPIQLSTGQPREGGKEAHSGLRVGPMERNAISAHNAPATAISKLKIQSDKCWVDRCMRCGRNARLNFVERRTWCYLCRTGEYVVRVFTTKGGGILAEDEQVAFGIESQWGLMPTGEYVTEQNQDMFKPSLI